MNCNVKDEQLMSYHLNELSMDESLEIDQHISTCTTCTMKLEELTILKEAWDTPNDNLLSDSFIDQVMETIPVTNKKNMKPRYSKYKSALHLALASAATFLLFYSGAFSKVPEISNEYLSIFEESTRDFQVATMKSVNWLSHIDIHVSQLVTSKNQ